ncbi:MAG: DEAD/DEAH box helicase [Candidatus Eisenbacteria bacterium]
MIDGPEIPLLGLRPLARGPQRVVTDPAAGDLLAGSLTAGRDAGQAPDFDAWLDEVRRRRGYHGELVHVERLSARPARHAEPTAPLPPPLVRALRTLGIERLYTHQAQAIDHVRSGRSVVLVTGTASGKTLAYNLPAVEALLADPGAHALYLFPTKALAQDQLKSLGRLLDAADDGGALRAAVHAGVYDGDTSTAARRKLRTAGNLVLSNPDMLHQGILPYHPKWARFFRGLKLVVVDEVHTYRGIFGSNVALVLRRLRRIANHYGADPVFVCCSATIRNPGELASALIGAPVETVTDDGSPRGPRTMALWNPRFIDREKLERKSANAEGGRIFTDLLRRGAQVIVFTKARVTAEIIYRYAHETLLERAPALAARIAPYRSGYLSEERRAIERRLFSGELAGVVSTNALELGIDVGSLDAAILVGFPPTIASTWQQAGRAGRTLEPSLAVVVAYNEPIDQYLMRHPEYFLEQTPEAAVVDPHNPYLLAGHLAAAAYELPVTGEDAALFGPQAGELLDALAHDGQVRVLDGRWFWASTDYPAGRINLRTISDNTFTIVDATRDNQVLGTVDAISAPELVYPEAIYLHEGRSYFVRKLDLEMKVAFVEPREVDYYTQPVLDTSILVRRSGEGGPGWRTRTALGSELGFGTALVSWATVGMKKVRFHSLDSIGYKPLDLPRLTLDTASLWWAPPAGAKVAVKAAGFAPGEGLSAVRNLVVTLMPLFAMCDPSDIGAVLDSKNLGTQALYVFDRYPGGLGFAEQAWHRFEELLAACNALVRDCPCDDGCPSCVGLPILRPAQQQDPDLSNGWPMPSKRAARALLDAVLNA